MPVARTPFAFQDFTNRIGDSSLTLEAAALPSIGPAVITVPSDPAPLGIRDGQTLIVNDGKVSHFNAGWGSTVVVNGGRHEHSTAVGAQVTISGGTVAGFHAYNGSVVNISGGLTFGGFVPWRAHSGSVVNISGGSHERILVTGGEVNISGGTLITIVSSGMVNISGGSVNPVRASSGCTGSA